MSGQTGGTGFEAAVYLIVRAITKEDAHEAGGFSGGGGAMGAAGGAHFAAGACIGRSKTRPNVGVG